MEMVKFIEHISHPGFGYIDPYMDEDDPLIHEDVGEMLAERLNELAGDYHRILHEFVEILDWHNAADKSTQSWKELDAILERQENQDEKI